MSENLEDLKHIRSMMERSTKFLSISGISGIIAGSAALLGSTLVYSILYLGVFSITTSLEFDIILLASLVLVIALCGGLYYSWKKAQKCNQPFWSNATKQILKDGGIPLIVGAIFCLLLYYNNSYYLISSAMLIFCGLACISVGARSYNDTKLLGVGLILFGICAGLWIHLWLLFWALGFGFLFIIYGIMMYYKYENLSSRC